MKPSSIHVVWSDLQIPYHDDGAVRLAMEVAHKVNATHIHLLGDVIDLPQLGKYDSQSDVVGKLTYDLRMTRSFLYLVREQFPKAAISYYEGNHEYRAQSVLWRRLKELDQLDELKLQELLHLKDYGITWYDYHTPRKVGKIWFYHGHICRSRSAYTARGMVEIAGGNVIVGHTHRMGAYYETTWENNLAAWENGSLCLPNQRYLRCPANWQQGFSVISMMPDQTFGVEQIIILNGSSAIFRGEQINVSKKPLFTLTTEKKNIESLDSLSRSTSTEAGGRKTKTETRTRTSSSSKSGRKRSSSATTQSQERKRSRGSKRSST